MKEINYVDLENGIRMAYIEEGNASHPVILMVHGLASYHGVWHQNIPELKHQYRCIAVDLPGSGYSSRGEYAYDIEFFAHCLLLFVDKLKLKKVIWCGHSMGGQLCLYVALHHPNYISKMILFAPASFEHYLPHEASLFKSAIILGDFMNLDEIHITNSIHSSFYATSAFSNRMINDLHAFIRNNDRRLYRLMMERSMNSMLDTQLFNQLQEISIPTLVFFGENDALIPNRFLHPVTTKAIAEQAAAKMPKATLITYPETGHYVQIEKAHSANEAMLRWLRSSNT